MSPLRHRGATYAQRKVPWRAQVIAHPLHGREDTGRSVRLLVKSAQLTGGDTPHVVDTEGFTPMGQLGPSCHHSFQSGHLSLLQQRREHRLHFPDNIGLRLLLARREPTGIHHNLLQRLAELLVRSWWFLRLPRNTRC